MMAKCFFLSFFLLSLSLSSPAQTTDSTRIIYVHILHGSKPAARGEYRSVGGYLGGHVVTQIDSFAYGFNFRSKRIRAFPRSRNSSGIMEKENYYEWKRDKARYKITTVEIPVSAAQYQQLKREYEQHVSITPYDYAFFGMRCAASCYHMLGRIGVVNPCSRLRSVIRAFHPKALRKRLVELADEKNYKIKMQPGSRSRKWEGD